MERLCSLAVGVALEGRAYQWLHAHLLHQHRRLQPCQLLPCDVFQGFRTRARALLSQQWDRGPHGFVRRADPLLPGPFRFFGWQAPAVKGGACGGLLFPHGIGGHLGLKLRLRRTQALLEHVQPCFYIKLGVPAPCGALGTRPVPPKRWTQVPPEAIRINTFISSDERFLNVEVRWV